MKFDIKLVTICNDRVNFLNFDNQFFTIILKKKQLGIIWVTKFQHIASIDSVLLNITETIIFILVKKKYEL